MTMKWKRLPGGGAGGGRVENLAWYGYGKQWSTIKTKLLHCSGLLLFYLIRCML